MEKIVKKYNLRDEQQYIDEVEYWQKKTPTERLAVAEMLRQQYIKLRPGDTEQGLQRIYRVIKRS
ncbi:MAG: hypothetical protein WEB89_10510 [Balneolales bacterium]